MVVKLVNMLELLILTYKKSDGTLNIKENFIKSLREQSDKNYEISIMINNCKEVEYHHYALLDSLGFNIKIYNTRSNSISRGRNSLIKSCRNPYYVLLDDDDTLKDNFIEIINRYLRENRLETLCYYNHELSREDKILKAISDHRFQMIPHLALEYFSPLLFCVYNRDFIVSNELYFPEVLPKPEMLEDVFYYLKLKTHISEVDYIHNVLLRYEYAMNSQVSKRSNPELSYLYHYLCTNNYFKIRNKFYFDNT